MYYSVLIETTEKEGKTERNKQYFEFDKTDLSVIKKRIIEPYLKKEDFRFDGFEMGKKELTRIKIKQSLDAMQKIAEYEKSKTEYVSFYTSKHIFSMEKYAVDITDTVLDEVEASVSLLQNDDEIKQQITNNNIDYSKIFIVHGRDDLAKIDVARFVEKLDLNAVILHEQASSGNTVIEKIEQHTNVGFAIVLYTPCDEGNLVSETAKPRARQNVVFEHGYLIGKLGRDKVCALVKGDIEKPNDISGVVYIVLDEHGAWKMHVVKELRTAGYEIDANKIF